MHNLPKRFWIAALAFAASNLLGAMSAKAACSGGGEVQSVSLASSSVANLGTYTPPSGTPGLISVVLNLSLTYTPGAAGNCQLFIGFRRPTLPATLSKAGGGSIPYALVRNSNGTTLVFSGTIPTTSTHRLTVNNVAPTRNFRIDLQMQPDTLANNLGGYYTDGLTLEVYNRSGAVVGSLVGQAPYTVNGTVATSCSISSATGTSQIIAVGATGLTSGMVGSAPQFAVTCNSSSNVTLSSQNGAVTRGGALESALATVNGFRNRIEYLATINGGAGNVVLDTSNGGANVSAVGTFAAAAVMNAGTVVTIQPETSSTPLLAGSYSDVLTVTIAPQ